MTGAVTRICPVCRASGWSRLCDPGPRSMASDLRVVDAPLGKAACERCGLIARTSPMPASLFASGYVLYAHPPGEPREAARQAHYAAWIASVVDGSPRSILDVGCGNGSLLLALQRIWPAATMTGCDPSPEAVAFAREAGLTVSAGSVDQIGDIAPDLIVTVNVVEHTVDPIAFLAAIAGRLSPDGQVVVICPDATTPGVEVLMADHEVSLAPAHLEALLARAGLRTIRRAVAPPALGQFQMAVARRSLTADTIDIPRHDTRPTAAYLERWAALDSALVGRIGGDGAVCFGVGEAAGLLRAYAPRTWERIVSCTADGVVEGSMFGDRPIIPIAAVDTAEALLLGVRPADQPAVAARLAPRHPRVIAWYDLI